jgi:hypothetical protein
MDSFLDPWKTSKIAWHCVCTCFFFPRIESVVLIKFPKGSQVKNVLRISTLEEVEVSRGPLTWAKVEPPQCTRGPRHQFSWRNKGHCVSLSTVGLISMWQMWQNGDQGVICLDCPQSDHHGTVWRGSRKDRKNNMVVHFLGLSWYHRNSRADTLLLFSMFQPSKS